MHFSSTARNIYLDLDGGFWLCCELPLITTVGEDPTWATQKFPLHDHFRVSYNGPRLRYGKDSQAGYMLTDTEHLDRSTVRLIGGTIVKVTVKGNNASGGWKETRMCLDFFLTATEFGEITSDAPSEYLCASATMFQISQEWNGDTGHSEVQLKALCIGLDGQLHPSSIDLCRHYVNDNGTWGKQKNGYFGDTAKDVGFDSYGHFNCLLKKHGYWNGPIDYDLYEDVHNVDGVLTIQDPGGLWDTRGPFFRILEEIPLLGYAVAVADFVRGDDDEADRALAECTLSTIAAVCCFAATAFLGPVGAVLAAAAVNTAAMLAREGAKANMGEPSFFTKSVGAALVGFFFSEFLVVASAGLDGLVGSYMDMVEEEFVASSIEGMVVDAATWGAKKGLKTLTSDQFKFLMNTVLDIVRNGGSMEDALAQVDAKIDKWFQDTQAPDLKKQIANKMTSLGYTWDDQTILDDIYTAAVTADYQDDTRLANVINTTVNKIVPDYSWTLETTIRETIQADGYQLTDNLVAKVKPLVDKYVYRKHDNLVIRITTLLKGMSLGDPDKVTMIKLSIIKIGYTYENPLVTKLLGMVQDYSGDLDETLKKIFAGLPASDRNSLDTLVSRSIRSQGIWEHDGDRQKIEDDLIRNRYIYDNINDLAYHLELLALDYCDNDPEHRIKPSLRAE